MSEKITIQDDEFCLIRVRDRAVIMPRLFLSDFGISEHPIMASRGQNNILAYSVNQIIKQEQRGGVSFANQMARQALDKIKELGV